MTTPTIVDIGTLLVVDPDYRSGRPCLRGTGITVHNVAMHYTAGMTVAEMVEGNPDLDPALFHAALAYYFANRARVDADIGADIRWEEEVRAKFPNGIGPGDANLIEVPD